MLETVKRALGAGGGARLYLVTAVALILLGTMLRMLGYFGGIEFWWDEALWAMRMARDQPAGIRPLGYVWVSRWLIGLHNTEPVLRSVSLAAGVLSLPAFLALCRRSGLSRLASLFGLFVLAVHPAAIDLTKEFKPYALEPFLHVLLLWLAFSFLKTLETRWLVWIGVVAASGALFSWSVVVLYPGLFATLCASAFSRRHLRQLMVAVGSGLVTAASFLTAYLIQLPRGGPSDHVFYGDRYDVFYVEPDILGNVHWLLERTCEVASFPARLETFWLDRPAVDVFAILQVALCLLGVVAIGTARRWDRAALWLAPWVVTVGLSLFDRWPYGVFRANLFLLVYSLLVGLAGLDGLQRWTAAGPVTTRLKGRLLVPAFCGAFVLAFLPLDLGFFSAGKGSGMAGNCHVHHALKLVREVERDEPAPSRRRRFLLDPYASGVYSYYRNDHLGARETFLDFFRKRYRQSRRHQPLEEAVDRQAERGFWLLACKPSAAASIRQYALDRCPQVDYLEDFRHGGLLLRCRGTADRLPLQQGERGGR